MLKPTCKDCTDRYIGCHTKCEKFIEYRKELDRINNIRAKNMDIERGFDDVRHVRKRKR